MKLILIFVHKCDPEMSHKQLPLIIFLLMAPVLSRGAEETFVFRHLTTADGLVSDQINAVYRDSKGFLWVGTGSGLDRYDAYSFSRLPQRDGSPGPYIISIAEDTEGQIWVHTSDQDACYSYDKEDFISCEEALRPTGIRMEKPLAFGGSPDHRYFWVADDKTLSVSCTAPRRVLSFPVSGGTNLCGVIWQNYLYYLDDSVTLRRANLHTGFWEQLTFPASGPDLTQLSLYSLFVDNGGALWVLSRFSGHILRRSASGRWEKVFLPDNFTGITGIAQDSAGNILLASSYEGLFVIHPDGTFSHVTHSPEKTYSLPGNKLSALFVDQDDLVWIGNSKLGLSLYSPLSQTPMHISVPGADDILSVCEVSGNVFLGTNGTGLFMAESIGMEFVQLQTGVNVVNAITPDTKGRLWIASWGKGGVICLDRTGRVLVSYTTEDGLLSDSVVSIREGPDGGIYIGEYVGVVQRLDPVTGEITTLYEDRRYNLRDFAFLDEKTVVIVVSNGLVTLDLHSGSPVEGPQLPEGQKATALFKDHEGLLWIAGRRGVWFWNPSTSVLEPLLEDDGRIVMGAKGVTEDLLGRIWISTSHGLIMVDRNGDRTVLQHYGAQDGIGRIEFNTRCITTLRQGIIVAGTPKGITLVYPQNGYRNVFDSRIYLTGADYPGADQEENKRIPLLENDEMVISNDMLPLSLYFSCLDFANPNAVTYEYRIRGYNDRWARMRGNGVRFSVLPPGKYQLQVRASNEQGVWSSYIKTLTLVVPRPWYRREWAYTLYACLILLVAGWLVRMQVKRRELAESILRMNKEAEDQQKLVDMKLTFFSGVSHELRTPLSLIINPLDEFIKRYPQYARGFLATARSNAAYLKELIDQLLSFRKIDAGGEKMQYCRMDIVNLLKNVFVSFQSIADKRKIRYVFSSDPETLEMRFDRDKMAKVLRNLLTNAFKFTPDGGTIRVLGREEDGWFVLCVSDTGPGIPEEDRENVFKIFFQSSEPSHVRGGSGIGLYLVDQYVSMHGGSILIGDNEPNGAQITLRIPLETEASRSEATEHTSKLRNPDIELTTSANRLSRRSVLVVDDNVEFLDFLAESLSEQYSVLRATGGDRALEILRRKPVELVISDVMMPNMSGIELCRTIKGDIRISHIPVLLLTAKSSEEFHLEGLREGADDYVTKPFNMDILLSRMEKLMSVPREPVPQGEAPVQPSRLMITPLDQQFVDKAIRVVEENLSNADFSVEQLSASLNLSRGYLYRKIYKLTGKSAIEFIRTIRMKRAQQLLAESQFQIAEVAYRLGYKSPKTFTKHFRQVFDQTPSEYLKSWK